MTNTQLFSLIFLVMLLIFIIFLLIATPSATQQAEMERQIAEEEDKLRQELSSYPRSSRRDEQDFINISNNIHSQAVAIVKARMKNKKVVKKEAREEKPIRAEILPSSTTSSKTEKQPSQNQQIVKEIAEKNKVKSTKLDEKSIEQQIEEEESRLTRDIPPDALDYKELRYIQSTAAKIVKERTKNKKI